MLPDGLYFWNQWVADVSVSTNKQANDLTNPAQLQNTYSDTVILPDTTAIRILLQNAEQLDAAGRDPYRLIPAKVIDEGEVIFSGDAVLRAFQGGWKVNLSAPIKGLFDQLNDIKLSDLNLSRYDHPWTLESIAGYSQNTDGIVYPAIDYGGLSAGGFPQDTLTPGIYAKTLVATMLQQVGYRPKGNWLTDGLYKRIALPFIEQEPQSHDDEWRSARQARVTVTGIRPISPVGNQDILLELNRDSEPDKNWVDGTLNNYKAESFRYVCDVSMRLHVQAFQRFGVKIDFGAIEAMLIVEKNGVNVAQEYFSESGPYNLLLSIVEILNLDTYIDCRAGDQIQLRFVLKRRSLIAQYLYIGFIREDDTWAAFEPDVTVRNGDVWPVAQNMPDMSCGELMKSIALMMSGTFEADDLARTVTLHTLDEVIANEANATDLSDCIEESSEPENAVIIPPYGQKNRLKWKEQEDKNLKGYGDGVILCNAQNIPAETPLFELPFSAVVDSSVTIPGYGNPPLIKTRVLTGSGSDLKVTKQDAPPCLVLVEPSKPVTVIVNEVTPELVVRPTEIPLTACWWHTRPVGLQTSENAFSLAFDRPAGSNSGEQTLSQRYFNGLRRILRRPRLFTTPVYLRPDRFVNLNLYAPVRLRHVRAGSLDINDHFFYLNKVSNYQNGQPCSITLIPY